MRYRWLLGGMGVLLLSALTLFAQDATPAIPDIDNKHANLAPFTSVIENPRMRDEPTLISVNGRNIEVPPHWFFLTQPEVAGLPPYVSRYADPGYRFAWDWVNGRAGFAQDGIQLYGDQRYVVRVNYETDLRYTAGDIPFVPSDFKAGARLYTAHNGFTELPAQAMTGLNATHELEWVIESSENPYPFVRLEAYFDVEWPTLLDYVYLTRIDIQTAPDDYKPDFVIPFE